MQIFSPSTTKYILGLIKTIEFAGKILLIYMEIFWSIILFIICIALQATLSTGGFKTPAKHILMTHLWGLFYLASRRGLNAIFRFFEKQISYFKKNEDYISLEEDVV